MKIKGYTLHGDYYLADEVIPSKDWKEACEIKKEIALPNGKTVIAHTLSKEELETISPEERECDSKWYWTSTLYEDYFAWLVRASGDFYNIFSNYNNCYGGARLGFKKPF